MTLEVSLSASYSGDDDFDFGAVISGLVTEMTGLDLGDGSFDPSAILAVAADLAPPDLNQVVAVAQTVATAAGSGAALDIDAEGLLAPVTRLLDDLGRLTSIDLQAGGELPTTGLDGLSLRLDQGLPLTAGPVAPLADLAGAFVPGFDLSRALLDVGSTTGGVIALVRLVGGLMAAETVAEKADRHARLLRSALDADLAAKLGARVSAEAGRVDLATAFAAADPDSGAQVETLAEEVARFVGAMRAMSDEWSKGMGLGEGALIGFGVAGCTQALANARLALDEGQLRLVGQLATDVATWLEPVTAVPLPDPQDSVDAMIANALGLTTELRHAVEELAPERAVAQVESSLRGLLAPLDRLADAVEAVSSTARNAIADLASVVTELDLGPIAAEVDAALVPVVNVLDGVEQSVGVVEDVIGEVAATITDALNGLAQSVGEIAALVDGALGRLSARLGEVNFEQIQADMEAGLGQVAATLNSAELSPYFSTSIDVVDTTASVIDAVPFGLLPGDVQQEIVDAVKPVKDIDFELIATDLRAELAAIVSALDADVLDAIDEVYQRVLTFLATIDPGPAIDDLEAGPLAELRARVDAVDPAAQLAPVSMEIDRIRGLLDGFELQASVLQPVTEVFDTIRDRLDDIDPVLLLAPLTTEVDQARGDLIELLGFDTWDDAIVRFRQNLVDGIERLDPEEVAAALVEGSADRLRSPLPSLSEPVGVAIAGLAESSGLGVDAGTFSAVLGWFNSAEPRASVGLRLQGLAEQMGTTRDAVQALDPAPIAAAAQSHHRRLVTAVSSHPEGSLLREVFDPLLANNQPSTILDPLVANRARYLARLEVDAGLSVDLAAGGLSQLNAVCDGLTDQLMPITSLAAYLRVVLSRFGLDTDGRGWGEMLTELFESAGPDRLLPPLVDLLLDLRSTLVALVDASVEPVRSSIADIRTLVDVLDLTPIVEELSVLHGEVIGLVDAADPAVLLGPTLDQADVVLQRVADFDPLAPVRTIIDTLEATIDSVFESTSPRIVFSEGIAAYGIIRGAAEGLDVRGLLQPVLDALATLGIQLDVGLEDVGEALTRLQTALPDSVEDSSASVGGSVNVGVSL